jgi:SAM-dependent methyltransferase
MNKTEKDQRFAAHVPGVLQYHQNMLSDAVRNELLYEAIRRQVNEGTNFLDIGAGTGVWAILAAKLGAKRVVAVEIEECLIPIIYKHAVENRVADRIEIIHGNSNHVKLRGKFDVIVSELFGEAALGKSTIDSFVNLRDRFLARGGVLIPQALENYAVPVCVARSVADVPAGLPLSCEYLKSLKLNYPRNVMLWEKQNLTFLAEPKLLLNLDFTTIHTPPSLELSAEWELKDISQVNAVAIYSGSIFTEDLRMDNHNSQSWGTTVYEFEPFAEMAGALRFDISMDENKTIWSASVPSNGELKPRSQSPSFAVARLRMTQQMTPHRKTRPSRHSSPVSKTKADSKR